MNSKQKFFSVNVQGTIVRSFTPRHFERLKSLFYQFYPMLQCLLQFCDLKFVKLIQSLRETNVRVAQ